jgi:hypothetical protein
MRMENASATSAIPYGPNPTEQTVVSGLFLTPQAAEEALRELREVGISTANISAISRDEDHAARLEVAGVSQERLDEEGLAYRASDELPNDEDLPATEQSMTDGQKDSLPIVTDYEVPPDEPYGGAERLGLTSDGDKVRRNEADTNADEDIYTDFPDEPGGINPDSPKASHAGADVHEPVINRTGATGTAAVGAGLGGLTGLLVGVAALAVPGVGPVIAAGPLAGALGGFLAGSATGGVIGAISTLGVPEEYAREYAARLQQGQTLIAVRTDDITRDLIERVLIANGGENVYCA